MRYEEFNKKVVLGVIEDYDIIEIENELSPTENLQYNKIYKQNSKSLVIAWLLWLFLGQFGAPMLYVGLDKKHSKGLFIFNMIILASIYMTAGVSVFFIIITAIWSAILINPWVKEANKQEKINTLKIIYATREKL